MNLTRPFIERPVATILLTVGVTLAGALAYLHLPVSPLPQVDYPTISVSASLPGGDPQTVSTSLSSNPSYRKVNPADAPLMTLALTSKTLTRGQLYDAASNVLQQRLSQLAGIGQVSIGGATLPAVRVELNPTAMFRYGIGLEDVRAALASANANSPKGAIEEGAHRFQLYTNDQARNAADFRPLIIAYRNGDAVLLSDLADVEDSVQDLRNDGRANGEPSVLVILSRQPGANIIDTVDQVKAELPQLRAALPSDVDVTIVADRSATIRASLRDTKWTLLISVVLVTLVVFLTLGDWRAAVVPAVAVPVSIIRTFSGMYLLGYSLDNLSLMALTIATGIVVDDAIVVLENISRHVENGMPRRAASLRGAKEVGFTVVSISISLIAVFIPILLMGGIVGRLFREFTGLITGGIVADQSISFQLMKEKLAQLMYIVQADPAVESVAGYTGAGSGGGNSQTNTGSVYVLLKPLSVRKISSDEVIARLRAKLAQVPGGRLFLQTVQDIRVGARQSNAEYQFTLQADTISDLYEWGPKLLTGHLHQHRGWGGERYAIHQHDERGQRRGFQQFGTERAHQCDRQHGPGRRLERCGRQLQ